MANVIDRELQDELWREELSAQLPVAVRYYDRRRYEIVRSWMPANTPAVGANRIFIRRASDCESFGRNAGGVRGEK
ncbi:MAG: hypothetical protein IT331_07645 [Anaerolineae bacterium]|nr:hypothetical protein [Anaerolineae bacterium]